MLANVTCPACQHRYYLDEGEMGSRQICPKCQSPFFAGKSMTEGRAAASPTLAAAAAAQPSYAKTMIGEAAPPIKYNCPRCKAPLEAEGIEGGMKKNCPNCTQRHQVPAAAKPEPVAQSPALNKTLLASDESAAPPPAPPIKYNCPGCKKPLESPVDQAGTKRNCPACNQRLQVPAAPSGKPNINKTMLAADESTAPATAAVGVPSANGERGSVPGAAPAPANPWALTPKNVAIGVVLLLLLLLIVPAVIRGGKSEDMEAVAKAKLELEKQKLDIEQKKLEYDRQDRAAAETRRRFDEESKERREQEARTREENRRALALADDDRKAALKKQQQQEQERREADSRERDAKFQHLLEESQKNLEKTKRDLEASQQKQQNTQTIIHQPPAYYYPPYHPRYYWPW